MHRHKFLSRTLVSALSAVAVFTQCSAATAASNLPNQASTYEGVLLLPLPFNRSDIAEHRTSVQNLYWEIGTIIEVEDPLIPISGQTFGR